VFTTSILHGLNIVNTANDLDGKEINVMNL